jgi:hypothetical protein
MGDLHPHSDIPISPLKQQIEEISVPIWETKAFPVLSVSKPWSVQFIFLILQGPQINISQWRSAQSV